MFTAKIQNKVTEGAQIRVFVEFTDGVTSVIESCIPQNEDGLKYWVKSRLDTFNSATTINSTYVVDQAIDVSEPVVVPPTPTAAELDEAAWLSDYRTWVKTTLIDTGILTGSETQLVNLKTRVQTNFKAAYLAKI